MCDELSHPISRQLGDRRPLGWFLLGTFHLEALEPVKEGGKQILYCRLGERWKFKTRQLKLLNVSLNRMSEVEESRIWQRKK